ncbi:MAG: DNA-protecting protein DprA [Calditrichaeota bacterium]|nr:MAG: DNA-protecting protein DprA [Calditrichota bacterium]
MTDEALLALYSVPGVGPARMRALIGALGSAEAVLDSPARRLMSIDGIEKKLADHIKNKVNDAFVREQLAWLKESGARLIHYWDSTYPSSLKSIFDPPVLLFAEGDVTLMDTAAIGVVGTRNPSIYGREVTRRFSEALAETGLTIVSGFARGVDTLAHKAAIRKGGKTIAVLGNGLDVVYPKENRSLLADMRRDGLRISEYPFGTQPDSGNFPKRNRIISGLSLGVLVVEAGAKSGALLTALYALDQNRDIFAIPGAITSPNSVGTNNLIKQGAKLVQKVDDILEELQGRLQPVKETSRPEPVLQGKAKQIYDVLEEGALHIDQIALRCQLAPSETLTVLLMMELDGHVRQMAGKMFVRA